MKGTTLKYIFYEHFKMQTLSVRLCAIQHTFLKIENHFFTGSNRDFLLKNTFYEKCFSFYKIDQVRED